MSHEGPTSGSDAFEAGPGMGTMGMVGPDAGHGDHHDQNIGPAAEVDTSVLEISPAPLPQEASAAPVVTPGPTAPPEPSALASADGVVRPREVLAEVTKDTLETGLRGVPVGYCTTSCIDAAEGLFYVGLPLDRLAYADPEDVIYLLMWKRLPDAKESADFRHLLRANSEVPEAVLGSLRTLPREGHPMKWLVHALNILGMCCSTTDYRLDAINVIAKIPTLVAAIFRVRSGWGDPIAPSADLGYMENFVHMLGVPGLDDEATDRLAQLMRVFDVVHFDHGGGNLSTFTGKAVASGHADMYESLTAAMTALAGPLHGGANEACLPFVRECIDRAHGQLNAEAARDVVLQKLANREIIYGFGHAVLRVEDPRAFVLRQVGDRLCPTNDLFQMVKLLAQVVPPILAQNPKISNPYPNVDSVSGTLLMACGLTNPLYYTVLFGMSRMVGIAAQIVYERCDARQGKGVPIYRPKYYYTPVGSAKAEGDGVEILGSG